jgi:hypothetical protein
MIICFTIAGFRHCFQGPILEWSLHFRTTLARATMTNFCKTVYCLV